MNLSGTCQEPVRLYSSVCGGPTRAQLDAPSLTRVPRDSPREGRRGLRAHARVCRLGRVRLGAGPEGQAVAAGEVRR
jgi:hypothetical protein